MQNQDRGADGGCDHSGQVEDVVVVLRGFEGVFLPGIGAAFAVVVFIEDYKQTSIGEEGETLGFAFEQRDWDSEELGQGVGGLVRAEVDTGELIATQLLRRARSSLHSRVVCYTDATAGWHDASPRRIVPMRHLPTLSLAVLLLMAIAPVDAAPRRSRAMSPHESSTRVKDVYEANRIDWDAPAKHVILISIDGLRPETYLNPKKFGIELPNLRKMMDEGAFAKGVRGIYPSVTYPSHTTLITGVRSSKHGILANSFFSPNKSGPADWYWWSEAIKTPTLWSLAKQRNMTVANLSWPVSGGCECDWNIPEIWDNSAFEQPNTMAILKANTVPPRLLDKLGEETTPWTDLNYNINVLERDLLAAEGAAWLFKTYKPNLFTIHLIEVDHFSHEEGANGPTALQALQHADTAVGMIMDAVKESKLAYTTSIIVTGDHGFADIYHKTHVNEWLKAGGFLTTDGKGKITGWQAQAYTSGAAVAIMLKDPKDKTLGQQIQAYFVRRLATIPKEDQPFRIMDKVELDREQAYPEAAFALALNPGWDVSKQVDAGDVSTTTGGTHGYSPNWDAMYTGFIAWGGPVNPHGQGDIIGITTIAPTVAKLLGLTIPGAEQEPLDWVFVR